MLTVHVNGISLAYERRGLGEPLVLIHGYPLDHTIWDDLAARQECNCDLIMPDVRGFGESGLDETTCTMMDLAADVKGLLDHLHVKTAYLAGHSMGGYIALAFAQAYPERVKGLALISSQALADTPEKQASRIAEAQTILADGAGNVAEGMPAKLTTNPGLQSRLRELIQQQTPASLACALRAMASRQDTTSFLQTVNYPVLVVHGLDDALIPVERARQVKSLVKNGSLIELEGVGHMPMMESPHKTAQALENLYK